MTKVDDKREAILSATLKLVSENGFHGTAMSKVAKEAKVSAGIIYHYFANKDELIVELYREIKLRSTQTQLKNHDPSQPLTVQIRQLWGDMLRYFIENPQETAYISQFSTSPFYTAEVEAKVASIYRPIAEIYERAMKEMIIKDMPMPVYATFAIDVPSALVRRQAGDQLELTEEVVEQVIDSLWQAIRL